jgi:tetratricopeptide (TPR) repeat protein
LSLRKTNALIRSGRCAVLLAAALCLLLAPTLVRAEVTEQAKKEFNRGVELAKAGKADSAIVAYEAAVAASPDYLQAHINVGALYYEKKQYADAARHLQAAVTLDSTNAEANKSLALVQTQAKEYDAAVASFQRLLRLDPKDAGSWASLGQVYKKKGDNKSALDAYGRAIALDPKDYKSHYNIGNIHQGAQRFDEAIAEYRQAITINPKYIEAYYNLAISSHQLDQAKCIPDYEAFLKVARGSSRWTAKVAEVDKIVKQIRESAGGGE